MHTDSSALYLRIGKATGSGGVAQADSPGSFGQIMQVFTHQALLGQEGKAKLPRFHWTGQAR